MKTYPKSRHAGFTLLETVIAIGLLAVLLTGFMVVFAPAAEGIRKSINVQEADRLTSALERELTTLRPGEEDAAKITTGFDKAYRWIEDSMKKPKPDVIFVYQYRGDLAAKPREDGSYEPYKRGSGVAGKDYVVTMAARRLNKANSGTDPFLEKDLEALEGRVFAVKVNQLVFSGNQLTASTKNAIEDPSPGEPLLTGTTASGTYPEGVIAFAADFHSLPSTSFKYLKSNFDSSKLKTPMFTRNLAVRR
ncbi:type II secretion system protein [bacterium]|nr:type II secretion system protein [bacterium]